ncbi:MAG: HTTM domain-containing protein [Actinophytocola sp.]|nr:HTTM domain-containing protein [Actinophytocola sp.]
MSAPTGMDAALARSFERITGTALGSYQTAVVRIGIAGTWFLLLLREWPNRHELYGPDGPFSWDMAATWMAANGAFSVLTWSDDVLWFELGYHFAMAAGLMLLLGWRTRTASVLFMIGVLSVQNRNTFVGDGGDNVLHLMAIYLVATRCGQVFSLDSRSRRLQAVRGSELGSDSVGVVLWAVSGIALAVVTALGLLSWGWVLIFWLLWLAQAVWWVIQGQGDGEPRTVCEMVGNLVHNGALLVIIVQVCLLYATAGWYKIQGVRWQDGTAAYYPMQVDAFTPWPALSDALSSYGLPVLLMTYGTVIVQVAFPFTLFNRRVKNVMLALLIGEHLGIAVLLGLPFFSLAIIAADLIFLPTNLLRWLERKVTRPIRRRQPAEPAATTLIST